MIGGGHADNRVLECAVAAATVKEIFESSRRGNGLKEICRELNGRGITNKGRRWQKNVVHYLLTNDAYTGTAVWGLKSKDEKAEEPVRARMPGPPWFPGRPSMWCSRGFTTGRRPSSGPHGSGASTS